MAQHRHVTCVRSDGLSAVLRPLLDDRRIVAATLVDVGSGLTLDGYADDPAFCDLELLGATQVDLVRSATTVATGEAAEITVGTGDGRHHLLHAVPDPHGDQLVVAVVVHGGPWAVSRVRRRLRTVSVAALTAGPTLAKRPVDGTWFPEGPPITEPIVRPDPDDDRIEVPEARQPADSPEVGEVAEVAEVEVPAAPAPPSAMLPRA